MAQRMWRRANPGKAAAFTASVLAGVLTLPGWAQQQPAAAATMMAASSPGRGTLARTVTVSATVESIDAVNRQLSLKGPRGHVFDLSVDPQVRNLEQVKVGDRVVVRYLEALSLTLMKNGKELRSSTASSDAARSPAGAQPGGAAARQVEVTADVVAVNAKAQTVTLRGPKHTVDLRIPDKGQFKLVKVGDQVQALYTEALAVGVEPARK